MADKELARAEMRTQLDPGESGSFEIPERALVETTRYVVQEFERELLHQAHRRKLVVTVNHDLLKRVFVVSWRPEGYPGSAGVYGLVR